MKADKKTSTLKWGFNLVAPYLLPYIAFMMASMGIKYLDTLEPMLSGWLIDDLTAGEWEHFLRLLVSFSLLFFLGLAVSVLLTYLRTRWNNHVTRRIELGFLETYLDSQMYVPDELGRDKVKNIILDDISSLIDFYTASIPDLLVMIFTILVISMRLLSVDGKLFGLAVLLSVFPILINALYSKPMAKLNAESRAFQDQYLKTVVSYVDGQKEISQNAVVRHFTSLYGRVLGQGFSVVVDTVKLNGTSSLLLYLVNAVTNIVVYLLLGRMVISGAISVGDFVSMHMLTSQLKNILVNIGSYYQTTMIALVAISRVREASTRKTNPVCWSSNQNAGGPCIEVRDFSFSYSKDASYVINHFSYTFHGPGLYLVKGGNGAGKTTLLNMLAGLFPDDYVSEGTVLVQSVAKPAYLMQKPAFFGPCFEDNVFMGKPAETALYDELKISFFGEETLNVENLSTGQQKKVAVIRLLCSESDILLMDEADAGLDTASVSTLVHLVEKEARSRLVIAVTHGAVFDNLPHVDILL